MDGALAGLGRVVIFMVLVVYYNVTVGLSVLLYVITHPLSEPCKIKMRAAPPDILSDANLGVSKYVMSKGKKIHYVETGDSTKELLLFLHGFPEFWYSWRYQLPFFSKDYWCVAIDLPGLGYSEKSGKQSDYNLNVISDDIAEMVRILGRKQCILVGHDWGAVIAWRVAARRPDCVRAFLTLAAPSQEILIRMFWQNWRQFKSSWYVCFFKCFWLPENWLTYNDLAQIANMITHKNTTPTDLECYKYLFGKPGAVTAALNYYRENFKFEIWLPDIQRDSLIPNLSILSEDDEHVNVTCATALKKSFKNTEVVVVKNAGHFIHQEQYEQVNQIISKFLHKQLEHGVISQPI